MDISYTNLENMEKFAKFKNKHFCQSKEKFIILELTHFLRKKDEIAENL